MFQSIYGFCRVLSLCLVCLPTSKRPVQPFKVALLMLLGGTFLTQEIATRLVPIASTVARTIETPPKVYHRPTKLMLLLKLARDLT